MEPPTGRLGRSARWFEKKPPSTRLTHSSKVFPRAAEAMEDEGLKEEMNK